jgi:hypothetical protein
MKIWLRTTGTALTAGAIAVAACGGTTAGPSGGSSSCDRYFSTLFDKCQNLPPPAGEVARIRARFDQLCANALALPGTSVTATSLDACTSAIESSGCNADQAQVCKFGPGTLADGSKCVSSAQCMSDTCSAGQPVGDGGVGVVLCGTCVAGQPCGSAVCPVNTICTMNGASGSCQPITFGDAGAACDYVVSLCKPGLVCNQASNACAAPGAAGSPCRTASDCEGSLVCPISTSGAPSSCQQPGGAGSACQSDSDCGKGLGCDYIAHQCGTVTWASAGQPCGPAVRCLVGYCPLNGTATSGTCQKVIADGQPCSTSDSTQTCDTLSECLGTCRLLGSSSCP